MCGIFAQLVEDSHHETVNHVESVRKIQHRGPDNTMYNFVKTGTDKTLYLGFNRLSINGLDEVSNQPFCIKNNHLICNGEIYNYKELKEKYNFDYVTNSDCEIIIHMYLKFGIKETLKQLDGVFAFVLYDYNKKRLYVARDPLGIRSLYYQLYDKNMYFSSELKAINKKSTYLFPPGHYFQYDFNMTLLTEFLKYYEHDYDKMENYENLSSQINKTLTHSVQKRLLSERPIACLLSGGLDSTLITALVCKLHDKPVETYSIGLEGSVDLKYAKIASEYLNTKHTTIQLTEQDFLEAIDKTIKQIESWDTTTVRASVGNYLVSLYISENSNNKVIFCGDVSDELFGSYKGFKNAPSTSEFEDENKKMVENVHMYDVLRSDKTISGAGLEARVPFADKEFIKLIMSIDPEYKMFNDEKIEKFVLRKAFNGFLPDELLWRRKEAFSDGVSSESRSWFEIIKEYVDTIYTDTDYEEKVKKYTHCPPYDKESLYYREIFYKYYPHNEDSIKSYWKQPFSTNSDPSARLL